MSGVIGFKWKPVGAQPIVVQMLKIKLCLFPIFYDHSASLKERHLVTPDLGGFGKGRSHDIRKEKKVTRLFEDMLAHIALAGFVIRNVHDLSESGSRAMTVSNTRAARSG
nr:hypothetical protein [Prosthecochloris sp. HL-130-GSB]